MIIVFEGIDGSGKTTQVDLLHQYLQSIGKQCTVLKCPDRKSPSGLLIASYLRGENKLSSPQIANLILAANIWEVAEQAKLLSQQGQIVIMDRFRHTHIAYSMARGSARQDCEGVLEGLPKVDVTVYLDVTPERALERKPVDQREILENPVFQNKVYQNYKSLMDPSWVVIEGAQDASKVHTDIVSLLKI